MKKIIVKKLRDNRYDCLFYFQVENIIHGRLEKEWSNTPYKNEVLTKKELDEYASDSNYIIEYL